MRKAIHFVASEHSNDPKLWENLICFILSEEHSNPRIFTDFLETIDASMGVRPSEILRRRVVGAGRRTGASEEQRPSRRGHVDQQQQYPADNFSLPGTGRELGGRELGGREQEPAVAALPAKLTNLNPN